MSGGGDGGYGAHTGNLGPGNPDELWAYPECPYAARLDPAADGHLVDIQKLSDVLDRYPFG